jgi:hypothetical protein
MAAAEGQSGNLTDDDLQSEIELVGDLVVAATSSDGPMPQAEIDRLLGVHSGVDEPEAEGEAQEAPSAKSGPVPES